MDFKSFYLKYKKLCGFALNRVELALLERFAKGEDFSPEFIATTARRFKVDENVVLSSWETAKQKLKQRKCMKSRDNELWQLPISWQETLELLVRAGISRLGDLRDRERLLKIKGIGPDKADKIAAALRIYDEQFALLPDRPVAEAAAELQSAFVF